MVIRVEQFWHGRVLGMMNISLQMLVVALAGWVADAAPDAADTGADRRQADRARGTRQPPVTAAYTSS